MSTSTLVIACDGPARSGKTTLANNFENKLGIPCLNTGKIYRILSVLVQEQLKADSLDGVSEQAIVGAIEKIDLKKLDITLSGKVFYDGKHYDELMTPEIANMART